MPSVTLQPSDKDTSLRENAPTTPQGAATYLQIQPGGIPNRARTIVGFDLTGDIPESASIDTAVLSLYYYQWVGEDPVGRTWNCFRLVEPTWVEAEATWEVYKTGSPWISGGGNWTTVVPASTSSVAPAGYGWVNWDVKTLVEDALANRSDLLDLIFIDSFENGASRLSRFYSKEYSDNLSLRPKLVVTYTIPDPQLVTPGTLALTITAYAPTITVPDPQLVTPGTLALTITAYAPTITVTAPIETLRPDAAGDECNIYSQINCSACPNHYTCVGEVESDGDTTRVKVNETNQNWERDLYNIQNSEEASVINFIKVYAVARADRIPTQTNLKIVIKSGGTVYEGSEITTTSSWASYSNQWDTNPGNAHSWTWDEINNLQIGVSLRRPMDGVGYNMYCTQVYVEVEYNPAFKIATPPTLALTLTTYAPTVEIIDHITVTPTTLALAISTYLPTILLSRVAIPSTLVLTINRFVAITMMTSDQIRILNLLEGGAKQHLDLSEGSFKQDLDLSEGGFKGG